MLRTALLPGQGGLEVSERYRGICKGRVHLVARRMLHPLQYLLVGSPWLTFFLLLRALSEHIAFGLACLVAAGAYGRFLIGSWPGALGLGAGCDSLCCGLYRLPASEAYALLMATSG